MTLSKSVLGSVAALSLTVVSAFASVPAQTSSCSYMFNTNLRLGAVSTDVQNLQKLLYMDAATKVASTGAGSMGYETLRFGPATMAAVKKFQAANGISPVSGYVGPLTRAALNTICTGNGSVSTNPSTNTGNTGISSNSIPVSVLVQGQAAAKLGEFVVTGNGAVTNITLQRTGLSNNSTLQNVYLYDGMTRLTDAASVRTDGSISFNSGAGLFMVNGSKTVTVRADIASSNTSGQTVGVALTGVTMMGGQSTPVTGVAGPLFSISSASTVTANLTSTTPSPSAATINAGSMNQTVWSQSVSIGTNPAKFNGITLKMIGSAPSNALANVQLFVDGVSKGMATINSNNQFVFDMSAMPVVLTTGAHLIEARADVVGGAYRNFYMSLEQAADLRIEDSTLPGVQVTPTYLSGSLTNVNGGTVTVNNGTLTITQDPAFNNTTTLVGGASQVTIASFKVTAYGEDVKITSLPFQLVSNVVGSTGGSLANVGLYVNGGQVGSNQSVSLTASTTAFSFTGLGSNLYVPAGQSVIVSVKADTISTLGATLSGGTLAANLTAGSSNAQGVSSSQLTSTSAVGGQSLTIGNNVTFGVTSGFGAATKAPNTTGVKIGTYSISAGSAEGLTVNQITVALTGTMIGVNQISNLRVMDGSTAVGTPVGNPTASNSFSANVTVPAGTTKVFDVYADFGSGASTYTAITAATVTYRGMVSNLSATTASAGGTVAITGGAATISNTTGVTLNSGSSPVSQLVVANQSNFGIATFNVKGTGTVGGAIIKDVTVTVPNNTATSVTINGKTANFVSGVSTSTAIVYNVGLTVPADAGGVNMPVTVSLACVGTSNGCSASSNASVYVALTTMTYYDGNTTQSLTLTPNVSSNAMNLVGSKPSFTVNTTQQTGLNIGGVENKIGEVTIAADAAGAIKVNNIAFNVGATGLTAALALTNVRIADGNATIPGSSISSGCTTTGACVMTLGATPNGYMIPAGTSKTFSLYGTITNSASASVVVSVSSSVTAGTTTWDDVTGGGTNLASTNVYNFPTGSYSIRQ